jgi:formylglycine-generating enzyme required for sulfatase activity
VVPVASCRDGWCSIPAGSWKSGLREWGGRALAFFPQFMVTLSRPFEVGMTEVTINEWITEMGGDDPSPFRCGSDCPVVNVSYFDVLEFANRLSLKGGFVPCYELVNCTTLQAGFGRTCEAATFLGPDCGGYRLPSEFEWELAANAGKDTCIGNHNATPAFGVHADNFCTAHDSFADIPAWYCGNASVGYEGCLDLKEYTGPSCAGPNAVAQRVRNDFGLYDMHGNVEEFTGSRYTWPLTLPSTNYPTRPQRDPGFDLVLAEDGRESDLGPMVVARGGSFANSLVGVCAASRIGLDYRGNPTTGFRLARTIP